MDPVSGYATLLFGFSPGSPLSSSLNTYKTFTDPFKVLDVILTFPQRFVLISQHLLRDLREISLSGQYLLQFLSFLINILCFQLLPVLLLDMLPLMDDTQDPTHSLIQLLHPSDLPALPHVGGVVLHGEFVSQHQVLLPHAHVP